MSTDNPWRRLDSRYVYQNPWISVREDQVICPDGTPSIYGVVESRIATGVVALTPGGDVYLVGQFRYPIDEYSWEIIEGGADENESPLAAAKRELTEEAGLVADSWVQLGGEIHLSNCFSAEVGYLYLATELREVQSNPEPTEILQVKRVPLKECLEMVFDGAIKDAMTIIGITRTARAVAR